MSIVTASFSPDGKILITGSLEGYLIEWDGTSGARRRVLLDPEGQEDGQPEVIWVENGVEVEPAFRLVRLSECMRGSSILCVRFSPDGRTFAVGAANGAVVLWNAESRGEFRYWSQHQDRVDALAISRDNRWLAVGSLEDAIDSLRVWRLEERMPFESFEAFSDDRHIGGVSCLCFSPDNRFLAAGGFSMSGYTGPFLFEVATGKRVGSLLYDMTQSLDYSPDGRLIATGDDFGTVKIWDAESRTKLFEEKAHERPIGQILFSRDGSRLASGGWDGTVRVWDVAAKERLAEYVCGGIVLAMRFDEDGRGLLIAAVAEGANHTDILRLPLMER